MGRILTAGTLAPYPKPGRIRVNVLSGTGGPVWVTIRDEDGTP